MTEVDKPYDPFGQPGNPTDMVFGAQLREELATYKKTVPPRGSRDGVMIFETPCGDTIVRINPLQNPRGS